VPPPASATSPPRLSPPDGHTVYASIRSVGDRNAAHAQELLDTAQRSGFDLRVVELDVQSQDSADQAVKTVLGDVGQLDVVIQNAGHLALGYRVVRQCVGLQAGGEGGRT
jgi:NAD(P)-dependent dehydrogenase (short-subunit alcohol dehydrogenase family)